MKRVYPYSYKHYQWAVLYFFRHGHVYLSHSGKMECLSLDKFMDEAECEERWEDRYGSV